MSGNIIPMMGTIEKRRRVQCIYGCCYDYSPERTDLVTKHKRSNRAAERRAWRKEYMG